MLKARQVARLFDGEYVYADRPFSLGEIEVFEVRRRLDQRRKLRQVHVETAGQAQLARMREESVPLVGVKAARGPVVADAVVAKKIEPRFRVERRPGGTGEAPEFGKVSVTWRTYIAEG